LLRVTLCPPWLGKGKSLGSILNEIPAKEQEIGRGKNEAISYAKRRWKDTQELIDNIQGITNEFENNLLSSLVFEGLVFRAGAPSLQYNFLENDWTNTKRLTPRYENKKIYIDNPQRITHEVITIDGKKPYWNVTAFESDNLKADTPYFLYIEASKTLVPDATGRMIGEARFAISDKKIKLEDKEGYYTFWVAFINSENEGQERSIRSMYGYTELLPGQITADTLISSDGNSYLDLANNAFRIGDNKSSLDWNVSTPEQLNIKNANFEINNGDNQIVIDPESTIISLNDLRPYAPVFSDWGSFDGVEPRLRFRWREPSTNDYYDTLYGRVGLTIKHPKESDTTSYYAPVFQLGYLTKWGGRRGLLLQDEHLFANKTTEMMVDVSREYLMMILRTLPVVEDGQDPSISFSSGTVYRDSNNFLKIVP
ncbi:hypothetical protein D0T84_10645, partial [Dysgonomonas sp. 521]|uniref:hypothetical protein n=1 Tax=Dysgonomonas sp. 521 TaxID=2302932 RepID=UPI0013D4B5C9